eukprot:jgi/Ulvmu1/5317/UM022_0111.1
MGEQGVKVSTTFLRSVKPAPAELDAVGLYKMCKNLMIPREINSEFSTSTRSGAVRTNFRLSHISKLRQWYSGRSDIANRLTVMARQVGLIRALPRVLNADWDKATLVGGGSDAARLKKFQQSIANASPEVKQTALRLQHCFDILLDVNATTETQTEGHALQDVAKLLHMPAHRPAGDGSLLVDMDYEEEHEDDIVAVAAPAAPASSVQPGLDIDAVDEAANARYIQARTAAFRLKNDLDTASDAVESTGGCGAPRATAQSPLKRPAPTGRLAQPPQQRPRAAPALPQPAASAVTMQSEAVLASTAAAPARASTAAVAGRAAAVRTALPALVADPRVNASAVSGVSRAALPRRRLASREAAAMPPPPARAPAAGPARAAAEAEGAPPVPAQLATASATASAAGHAPAALPAAASEPQRPLAPPPLPTQHAEVLHGDQRKSPAGAPTSKQATEIQQPEQLRANSLPAMARPLQRDALHAAPVEPKPELSDGEVETDVQGPESAPAPAPAAAPPSPQHSPLGCSEAASAAAPVPRTHNTAVRSTQHAQHARAQEIMANAVQGPSGNGRTVGAHDKHFMAAFGISVKSDEEDTRPPSRADAAPLQPPGQPAAAICPAAEPAQSGASSRPGLPPVRHPPLPAAQSQAGRPSLAPATAPAAPAAAAGMPAGITPIPKAKGTPALPPAESAASLPPPPLSANFPGNGVEARLGMRLVDPRRCTTDPQRAQHAAAPAQTDGRAARSQRDHAHPAGMGRHGPQGVELNGAQRTRDYAGSHCREEQGGAVPGPERTAAAAGRPGRPEHVHSARPECAVADRSGAPGHLRHNGQAHRQHLNGTAHSNAQHGRRRVEMHGAGLRQGPAGRDARSGGPQHAQHGVVRAGGAPPGAWQSGQQEAAQQAAAAPPQPPVEPGEVNADPQQVRVTIDAATLAAAVHMELCARQALSLTNNQEANKKIRAVHMHRNGGNAFDGDEPDVDSVCICRAVADVVCSVASALDNIMRLPDVRQAVLAPYSLSTRSSAKTARASGLPSLKAKAARILAHVSARLEDAVPAMISRSGRKSEASLKQTAEAEALLARFMLVMCQRALAAAAEELAAAAHPGQPAEVAQVVQLLLGVLQCTLAAVEGLAAAIKELTNKPGYADDPKKDNRDLERIVSEHLYRFEQDFHVQIRPWVGASSAHA